MIDQFLKIFWVFVFISLIASIGQGPTLAREIARVALVIIVLVGIAFKYARISRRLFIGSEITLIATIIVAGFTEHNEYVIGLGIALYALIGLLSLEYILSKKFNQQKTSARPT